MTGYSSVSSVEQEKVKRETTASKAKNPMRDFVFMISLIYLFIIAFIIFPQLSDARYYNNRQKYLLFLK